VSGRNTWSPATAAPWRVSCSPSPATSVPGTVAEGGRLNGWFDTGLTGSSHRTEAAGKHMVRTGPLALTTTIIARTCRPRPWTTGSHGADGRRLQPLGASLVILRTAVPQAIARVRDVDQYRSPTRCEVVDHACDVSPSTGLEMNIGTTDPRADAQRNRERRCWASHLWRAPQGRRSPSTRLRCLG